MMTIVAGRGRDRAMAHRGVTRPQRDDGTDPGRTRLWSDDDASWRDNVGRGEAFAIVMWPA